MNHSLPLIVIYPDRPDIRAFPQKRKARYEPLLDSFRAKGYRFIDLMAVFNEADPALDWKTLSVDQWGHYSPSANRSVAESLLGYFGKQELTSRERIKQAIAAERGRLGL